MVHPSSPSAIAILPARYDSQRFPGKPLAAATGKPLIQHVVENARRARRLDRVVVATDHPGIFEAVTAFGGEVVMTGVHPNGTSRIAEAIEKLGAPHPLVLNVQGDEPEIDPAVIDALVEGLAADPQAQMATLHSPFGPGEDRANPNIVKVVKDRQNRALYFSRSLIPFDRDQQHPTVYKHPGLYAFRRDFLRLYPTLEPTPLEEAEKLEQLRVLEHGYRIALIPAAAPHPGIDTPEQYQAFVERHRAGQDRLLHGPGPVVQ